MNTRQSRTLYSLRSRTIALAAILSSVAAPSWASTATNHAATRAEAGIGLIEIEESPRERPSPLSSIFENAGGTTLRNVIDKIEQGATDDELNGIVIRLRGAPLSLTQVEELGAAITKAREAGKAVHLFSEMYQTPELLLGAYADEVIIQDGGALSFPGMYMEELYLADTLAWAGIKAELIQVGDYKGANESMVNTAPSPAWEKNISGLLDSLYGQMRERIIAGRKLNEKSLDDAMRKAWMANAETGKSVGLLDAAIDLPNLTDHLTKRYGPDIAWSNILRTENNAPRVRVRNPGELFSRLASAEQPQTRRDTIAIVHIDGPIVDGHSSSGGLGGDAQVGSWTIRKTLGELEEDENIKGVILRVNSPGGSAIASEIIWHGVKRLGKAKPVWVSVGSMAASGGYYIAVAGDKIYVNPSSIVGSIGVVGGKMAIGGLYDKLKVHVVGRSRGPVGGLLQSPAPWTDAERAIVREKMAETYTLFTDRVRAGRQDIDLARVAEGRLFTGRDALGLKLADQIGGLDLAIDDMAAKLNLAQGSFDVLDYPESSGLGEFLGELLGASAPSVNAPTGASIPAPLAQAVRELLGPAAWESVRDQYSAMMQLRREPVILVSPRAIILK